jgi:hypothetical protein
MSILYDTLYKDFDMQHYRNYKIYQPLSVHQMAYMNIKKINVKLEDHIDHNINELTTARNNLRVTNFLNLKNQFLRSSHKLPTI